MAKQRREGDLLPAGDYEPAHGEMHDIHSAPPLLQFSADRAGDALLQQGL